MIDDTVQNYAPYFKQLANTVDLGNPTEEVPGSVPDRTNLENEFVQSQFFCVM